MMYDTIWSSQYSVAAAVALITLTAVWIFNVGSSSKVNPGLPFVKVAQGSSSKDVLRDSYKKYSKANQSFNFKDDFLTYTILPMDLMNEIKYLPVTKASAMAERADMFFGNHTGIGVYSLGFLKTMKDITKINAHLISEFLDEVEHAVSGEIGSSKDWTVVPVLPVSNRIVATMIGRDIAGMKFGRDERWLEIASTYVRASGMLGYMLHGYPRFSVPFVAPFLAPSKIMKRQKKQIRSMIEPYVNQFQRRGGLNKEPENVLETLMEGASYMNAQDLDDLTQSVLSISQFGILTVADALSHVLCDLAVHNEYQQILREELLSILKGRPLQSLNQQQLTDLRKFDSFMKESQRLAGPASKALMRKIVAPGGLTLSNGLHLLQNSYVAVPANSILRDPDVFEEPNKFKGLRFYDMRQTPGEENKHQYVSLSDTSLNFGAGPIACPGRFLVSYEIKIVVAYVLLNYELKLADEEKGKPELGTSSVTLENISKLSFKRKT